MLRRVRVMRVLLVIMALFAISIFNVIIAATKVTELTFWTNLTVESQAKVIRQQLMDIAAKMPGVNIKFEAVPISVMYNRLLTAVGRSSNPNIMQTSDGPVAFLQAKDVLVSLDDLLDSIGRNEFFKSALRIVSRHGKAWAIPDWGLHTEVWYRKDLFKEKGLSIPKSWDEMLKVAKALNIDDNGDGKIDIYGMAIPMNRVQVAMQTYYQILYSAGIYTFDPATGEYMFGSHKPEAVKALKFMIDLYKAASPPASIDWSWGEFRTAYVQGTVAQTPEWGAVVLQAAEQNPSMLDKMGVYPFPGPDPKQPNAYSLGGGYYFVVGQAGRQAVTLSKEIVKQMMTPARVAERANSRPMFAIPAMKSAYNTPIYQKNSMVKRFKPEVETIFNNVMPSTYRYGMEGGLHPISGQMEAMTFIGDAIQNVALGRWTAEQAVDDIDQQFLMQLSYLGR